MVAEGGKNAAGGVHIEGRRFEICPKVVSKHKLSASSVREIKSQQATSVECGADTKAGVRQVVLESKE